MSPISKWRNGGGQMQGIKFASKVLINQLMLILILISTSIVNEERIDERENVSLSAYNEEKIQ